MMSDKGINEDSVCVYTIADDKTENDETEVTLSFSHFESAHFQTRIFVLESRGEGKLLELDYVGGGESKTIEIDSSQNDVVMVIAVPVKGLGIAGGLEFELTVSLNRDDEITKQAIASLLIFLVIILVICMGCCIFCFCCAL